MAVFKKKYFGDKTEVSKSLLSFERAIEETLLLNRVDKKPIGYEVTEQGIVLLWE